MTVSTGRWGRIQIRTECVVVVPITLLLLAMPAWGETLWVRHALTSGANDGSSYESAFQGLASVVQGPGRGELGAGDTLYVCGGPHDQLMVFKQSGSASNEITVDGRCSSVNDAYEDGVIGRRSLHLVGSQSFGGQIFSLSNDAYIILQNLTFQDPFGVRQTRWSWGVRGEGHTHAGGTWCPGTDGVDDPTLCDRSRDGDPWRNTWTNGLVGGVVMNVTDRSRGVITANTETTITADLECDLDAPGCDADWDAGDRYVIVEDTGQILLAGSSHHITIRHNTFDLTSTSGAGGTGYAVFFRLSTNAKVRDILIQDNAFAGKADCPIGAQAAYDYTGVMHHIVVKDNTATGVFAFFCHRGSGQSDPDDDGYDDDDYSPYGIDIQGNTISIADGGHAAITLQGLRRTPGEAKSTIRNNVITQTGVQGGKTNTLQIHWAKDLIIENNTIEGPHLTSGCDGSAIIIDWAFSEKKEFYLSDDIIIRGNTVYGASSDCTGKAIAVYRGRNIQIDGNLIVDSDVGIRVAGQAAQGAKCTDEGVPHPCCTGLGAGQCYVTENIRILNNTIVNAGVGDCSGKWGECGDGITVEQAYRDIVIANNLIVDALRDGIDDNAGIVGEAGEAHNLVYNAGGNDCEGAFGSRDDNTCSESSITDEDPLFATVDNNYALRSESLAMNAGVDVGLAFCGPAPEIGYWEACDSPKDSGAGADSGSSVDVGPADGGMPRPQADGSADQRPSDAAQIDGGCAVKAGPSHCPCLLLLALGWVGVVRRRRR